MHNYYNQGTLSPSILHFFKFISLYDDKPPKHINYIPDKYNILVIYKNLKYFH